jgi:cadherin EGF LAG seven-pass G-type receptor 1
VTDANDHAPAFDRDEYVVQVSEAAPRASPVVRVKAHDTDAGANAEVVYRIVGGNEGGEFYLNPKTGLISTAKPLDTEKTSLHTLTVLALDQGNKGARRQSAAKVIVEVSTAHLSLLV